MQMLAWPPDWHKRMKEQWIVLHGLHLQEEQTCSKRCWEGFHISSIQQLAVISSDYLSQRDVKQMMKPNGLLYLTFVKLSLEIPHVYLLHMHMSGGLLLSTTPDTIPAYLSISFYSFSRPFCFPLSKKSNYLLLLFCPWEYSLTKVTLPQVRSHRRHFGCKHFNHT